MFWDCWNGTHTHTREFNKRSFIHCATDVTEEHSVPHPACQSQEGADTGIWTMQGKRSSEKPKLDMGKANVKTSFYSMLAGVGWKLIVLVVLGGQCAIWVHRISTKDHDWLGLQLAQGHDVWSSAYPCHLAHRQRWCARSGLKPGSETVAVLLALLSINTNVCTLTQSPKSRRDCKKEIAEDKTKSEGGTASFFRSRLLQGMAWPPFGTI